MSLRSRNLISFLIGIHLLLMCSIITVAAYDAAHQPSPVLFVFLWAALMMSYLAYTGAMAINTWAFSVIKNWSVVIISLVPLGSYFYAAVSREQAVVTWVASMGLLLIMNYMVGLVRKYL